MWPELLQQVVLVMTTSSKPVLMFTKPHVVKRPLKTSRPVPLDVGQIKVQRCSFFFLLLPVSSLLELIFPSDRVHRPRPPDETRRSVLQWKVPETCRSHFVPTHRGSRCGEYQRSVNFRKQLSPVCKPAEITSTCFLFTNTFPCRPSVRACAQFPCFFCFFF